MPQGRHFDQTYYRWRKKYGWLMPSEMKRLKLPEEENIRLKRLMADLSLDKAMLQDVVREMYGPPLPCKTFVAVSEDSLL